MKLQAIRETGGGRTATINGDFDYIKSKLGEPNVTDIDDYDKVKASWGFMDEEQRKVFVWCYKQSTRSCRGWSADGDKGLLQEIFGANLEF